MDKIAIDIVLLLEEEMASRILELNKELVIANKSKIVLGKKINQPHISLCMGGVNKFEMPKIINCIDKISNEFSPFNFQGKLSIQSTPDHEKILWLDIEKDEIIQKIHEVVMRDMFKYLDYDITKEMLVDPANVEENTLSWIKSFANLHRDPSLFSPHVTVGVGDAIQSDAIFNFSSSTIAIFKLGNYCTCKELIYSTNLN